MCRVRTDSFMTSMSLLFDGLDMAGWMAGWLNGCWLLRWLIDLISREQVCLDSTAEGWSVGIDASEG